jgi:hypothetical protein
MQRRQVKNLGKEVKMSRKERKVKKKCVCVWKRKVKRERREKKGKGKMKSRKGLRMDESSDDQLKFKEGCHVVIET